MSKIVWLSLPMLDLQDVNKMFQILGYKSSFLLDIYRNHEEEYWKQVTLGKQKFDITFLEKYDAVLPPISNYYKEILRAYPDAKFIYQKVNSSEVYKRHKKLKRVLNLMSWLRLFPKSRAFHSFVMLDFNASYQNLKTSIDIQVMYNHMINDYQKYIPSHQLLEFSSEDGWQPICDFLGQPIPTSAMPIKDGKSNVSTNTFSVLISKISNNLIIVLLYFAVLIGLFVYLIFFY